MTRLLPTTNMNTHRVAIVGAGAAGLSAAYAFSKHPDKYTVTVFEKEHVTGGMASSMNIDPKICGASYINDGVQGCSPAFANTLRIFRELGYPLRKISFGKGEHFWTNVFPSPLTERFAADVRKFGRVLNIVKLFEVVLALLPIYALLRLFRLSKDFGERMVYPLAALFFGTGNQTPYVASVILERVFKDPSMRLFEYDKQSGNVTFLLGHIVTRVVSRTKQRTVLEFLTPSSNEPQTAEFDSLILATDANNALTILGKEASWMERRVLGGVKYLHDLTVTHTDVDYMRKHYETEFKPELIASSATPADRQRGETDFRPLYYTYQYPSALKKLEMSFDLTIYQPQFSASAGPSRVYQTIFLDKEGSGELWTKGEIKQELVVGEKWWKQQSHRWQHYARVVPWMWAINGTRGTWLLVDASTVFNMHELAITSGFAAAYRLGADFPHLGDETCVRLFRLYLGLSHAARLRKRDRKDAQA
ncbi:hypothetical protein BGY98DRAFT_992293 [Russula aff. rugulosa BPL654]|nr:hypothetical protein BGY98DRAFT_992293 [Russula aff. rugulosa BPL654]